MVASSGDEQPIDLSRASKKSTRLMPPLIPISLLPYGYHQRRFLSKDLVGVKRSANIDNNDIVETNCKDGNWRISPKRSRLDRARSVPQLTPLPALQRHKSLSESRIPQPRRDEPWLYIGYYSQLLHRFQAQFALQQHQTEKVQYVSGNEISYSIRERAQSLLMTTVSFIQDKGGCGMTHFADRATTSLLLCCYLSAKQNMLPDIDLAFLYSTKDLQTDSMLFSGHINCFLFIMGLLLAPDQYRTNKLSPYSSPILYSIYKTALIQWNFRSIRRWEWHF